MKDDKLLSRNIKIYLSWKHTGNRLDDIGAHFGIVGPGGCQARRRISERVTKDKFLAKINLTKTLTLQIHGLQFKVPDHLHWGMGETRSEMTQS